MMKHEEIITLIGNMFINAYVAGGLKDLDSVRSARADRDHLFDEIRELYAELEMESCNREQIQVELNKANHRIEGLQRDYDHMREIKDRLLLLNRRKDEELQNQQTESYCEQDIKTIDWLKKNTTVFDNFPEDDIPDDADKFSEQDLPFPDVEDLAPASEVEGSEE